MVKEKIIVALLIVAIVLSIGSIIFTSNHDFGNSSDNKTSNFNVENNAQIKFKIIDKEGVNETN